MLTECRAGKKKFLTDSVDIIPFPSQNLREKARQSVNKPAPASIPQERPSYTFKKEVRKLSVPTGKLNTTHISMKKMMEQSGVEENATGVGRREQLQNDFSFDQLLMAWKSYAFQVKEEGQETIFSAMTKRDPKLLQDHTVQQTIDNQVQMDYMHNNLFNLEEHLRSTLKNYSIRVVFELSDNPDDVKFLSGKDKFAAMARKNPSLHTLKSRFDLDIEF